MHQGSNSPFLMLPGQPDLLIFLFPSQPLYVMGYLPFKLDFGLVDALQPLLSWVEARSFLSLRALFSTGMEGNQGIDSSIGSDR